VTEDNVKIVRGFYDAQADGLLEGGMHALIPIVHPDFEFTTPPTLASEPGTFRGEEGIRRYVASFNDAMEGVYFEGIEFTAVGDAVLVETILHARGRTTGIETEQQAFILFVMRDGLVLRIDAFAERDEALQAAGSPD
jgi:ketosteroid isomerase-like protein